MKYTAMNEADHFSYNDAIVLETTISENKLAMTLEALIVKASNSQNTNYTDSYADLTLVEFNNAKAVSICKEGYKFFDANDNLIEEIKDEYYEDMTLESFFKDKGKMFLISFEVEAENDGFVGTLEFEMPAMMGDFPDTYELKIQYESVSFAWDRYLNRVSN